MVPISSFMYLNFFRKGMKYLGDRPDQRPCLAKVPLGAGYFPFPLRLTSHLVLSVLLSFLALSLFDRVLAALHLCRLVRATALGRAT